MLIGVLDLLTVLRLPRESRLQRLHSVAENCFLSLQALSRGVIVQHGHINVNVQQDGPGE